MIRTVGKPSRIKDRIGVAVLAATAVLYAFEAGRAGETEACQACEADPAARVTVPADAPPAELISTTPEGDSLVIELHALRS
jgi:hypothetical protein